MEVINNAPSCLVNRLYPMDVFRHNGELFMLLFVGELQTSARAINLKTEEETTVSAHTIVEKMVARMVIDGVDTVQKPCWDEQKQIAPAKNNRPKRGPTDEDYRLACQSLENPTCERVAETLHIGKATAHRHMKRLGLIAHLPYNKKEAPVGSPVRTCNESECTLVIAGKVTDAAISIMRRLDCDMATAFDMVDREATRMGIALMDD